MLVLGIESSCDETAAAVVRDGTEILSSVISSQISLHEPFGGVVPEIASREHLAKIRPVVDAALERADKIISDIGLICVTQGPGLIGSLLVGVSYAKALAYARDLPIVGVNHIEGHVYSVVFENGPIKFPALALIVSGGHTNLFYVREEGSYEVVSRTRDDAAGEAFDKVAKMLGLGYPGGPEIERLASLCKGREVKFPLAKISDGRPDFSFSGLKTAVSRYVSKTGQGENGVHGRADQAAVAAGFQTAVVTSLSATLRAQTEMLRPKTIIVAGGVACNLALRTAAAAVGREFEIPVYFPSKELSTDNAAMIAAAGFARFKRGGSDGDTVAADISMRLQNVGETNADLRAKKVRYKL